jgi:hypothetical protein
MKIGEGSSSDPKWRVFESVHISTHIIYAVLTEKALNPFVECASGLLSGEGFSITLKFGRKRSIEHIQSLSELPSLAKKPVENIRACSRNEWLGWLLSRSATSLGCPGGRAPTGGIYRAFS